MYGAQQPAGGESGATLDAARPGGSSVEIPPLDLSFLASGVRPAPRPRVSASTHGGALSRTSTSHDTAKSASRTSRTRALGLRNGRHGRLIRRVEHTVRQDQETKHDAVSGRRHSQAREEFRENVRRGVVSKMKAARLSARSAKWTPSSSMMRGMAGQDVELLHELHAQPAHGDKALRHEIRSAKRKAEARRQKDKRKMGLKAFVKKSALALSSGEDSDSSDEWGNELRAWERPTVKNKHETPRAGAVQDMDAQEEPGDDAGQLGAPDLVSEKEVDPDKPFHFAKVSSMGQPPEFRSFFLRRKNKPTHSDMLLEWMVAELQDADREQLRKLRRKQQIRAEQRQFQQRLQQWGKSEEAGGEQPRDQSNEEPAKRKSRRKQLHRRGESVFIHLEEPVVFASPVRKDRKGKSAAGKSEPQNITSATRVQDAEQALFTIGETSANHHNAQLGNPKQRASQSGSERNGAPSASALKFLASLGDEDTLNAKKKARARRRARRMQALGDSGDASIGADESGTRSMRASMRVGLASGQFGSDSDLEEEAQSNAMSLGQDKEHHLLMQSLNHTSLGNIKREFQNLNDSLSVHDFVRVMRKYLDAAKHGGTLHITSLLCRLFSDIDVNGDGTMEWDEFTSFIVETGMNSGKSGSTNASSLIHAYSLHRDFVNPSAPHDVIQRVYYNDFMDTVVCLEQDQPIVRVYDAKNMALKKEFAASRPGSSILSADYAVFEDNVWLVASTSDTKVKAFNAADNYKPINLRFPSSRAQLTLKWVRAQDDPLPGSLCEQGVLLCADDLNRIELRRIEHASSAGLYEAGRIATFHGHTSSILDMTFLENMRMLASASLDKTIRLWDINTQKLKHVLAGEAAGAIQGVDGVKVTKDRNGHQKGVFQMDYHPDYHILFSAAYEADAVAWNPFCGKSICRIQGHYHPLAGVRAIPGTPQVVTADTAGIVKVWDIRNFGCVQTIYAEQSNGTRAQTVTSFVTCPSHRRLVVGGLDLSLYDSMATEHEQEPDISDVKPTVSTVYNARQGKFLSASGTCVKSWDERTGVLVSVLRDLAESEITCMCMDQAQKKLIIGTASGELKVLNALNGSTMKSWSPDRDEAEGPKKASTERKTRGTRVDRKKSRLPKNHTGSHAGSRARAREGGNHNHRAGLAGLRKMSKMGTPGDRAVSSVHWTAMNARLPAVIICTAWDGKLRLLDESEEDLKLIAEVTPRGTGNYFSLTLKESKMWLAEQRVAAMQARRQRSSMVPASGSPQLMQPLLKRTEPAGDVVCSTLSSRLMLLAVGTSRGDVFIFELGTREPRFVAHFRGHCKFGEVTAVCFLDPFPVLAVADSSGNVCLWAVPPLFAASPAATKTTAGGVCLLRLVNAAENAAVREAAVAVTGLVFLEDKGLWNAEARVGTHLKAMPRRSGVKKAHRLYVGDVQGVVRVWDVGGALRRWNVRRFEVGPWSKDTAGNATASLPRLGSALSEFLQANESPRSASESSVSGDEDGDDGAIPLVNRAGSRRGTVLSRAGAFSVYRSELFNSRRGNLVNRRWVALLAEAKAQDERRESTARSRSPSPSARSRSSSRRHGRSRPNSGRTRKRVDDVSPAQSSRRRVSVSGRSDEAASLAQLRELDPLRPGDVVFLGSWMAHNNGISQLRLVLHAPLPEHVDAAVHRDRAMDGDSPGHGFDQLSAPPTGSGPDESSPGVHRMKQTARSMRDVRQYPALVTCGYDCRVKVWEMHGLCLGSLRQGTAATHHSGHTVRSTKSTAGDGAWLFCSRLDDHKEVLEEHHAVHVLNEIGDQSDTQALASVVSHDGDSGGDQSDGEAVAAEKNFMNANMSPPLKGKQNRLSISVSLGLPSIPELEKDEGKGGDARASSRALPGGPRVLVQLPPRKPKGSSDRSTGHRRVMSRSQRKMSRLMSRGSNPALEVQ